MENIPELIYCANYNKKYIKTAIELGFSYGCLLPGTVSDFPIEFADQNWKNPEKEKYILAVKKHKPRIATVIDLERESQFETVLEWAEEISSVVDKIIIIPKVDLIERIPYQINSKEVILGYSVPTKYSGTKLNTSLFKDRKVHLLGGSPDVQIQKSKQMNVVSADCNMHQMMANKYGLFFDPTYSTRMGLWTTVACFDGKKWGDGSKNAELPSESFRRSCININALWGIGDYIKREKVFIKERLF